MGNSLAARTVVPDNWEQVTTSTYRNLKTGEEVVVGSMVLPDGTSIDEYCEWYQCRLSPSTRYVRVIYYSPKAALCCASKKEILVLTEKVHRLDELKLSVEQLNFLFQEALLGFRQLVHTFGSFLIDRGMICVNEQGQVKVWIKDNFAQNHFSEDEDESMTQQIVLNSLIEVVDGKGENGRRLDTAYREFSKVRTFETALAFIQQLQARQQFQVRQVFLDRSEFEAYRTKATREGNVARPPLDFSFASKANKLEFSFAGKTGVPCDAGDNNGLQQPERKKSRIVYCSPSPQPNLSQVEAKKQDKHVRVSRVTAMPLSSNLLGNPPAIGSHIGKPHRSTISSLGSAHLQDGLPHRQSAGTSSSYLEIQHQHKPSIQVHPPAQPQQQRSRVLPTMHPHSRREINTNQQSQFFASRPQQQIQPVNAKANFPINPMSQTDSTINSGDISQSVHRNTLNSMVSNNSTNPNHRENGPHNSSNLQRENYLDWTLNRVSAPQLKQSNNMKKSDSERLMEYRHAEMYRSIPTVDSMIIISRSDKNEIVDPKQQTPEEGYQLIESTIVRDLNSFSRFL